MGKECSEEKETVCHKSQGKIISQKEGLSSLVNIMNKYQMKMRKKEIRKQTPKVCEVWMTLNYTFYVDTYLQIFWNDFI